MIQTTAGPMEVRDGYEICKAGLAEFFERVNKTRLEEKKDPVEAFHPIFFSTDLRKVYLKPAP